MVVVIVASIIPVLVMLSMHESLLRLFFICILSVVSVLLTIYGLGLSSDERKWLNGKVVSFVKVRMK